MAVVGSGHVRSDPAATEGDSRDWTGRFFGIPVAVVRPADVAEVSGVLRVCESHGAAVVPQGGNTGLVGGSVPRGGEVLLSLRRLGSIGEVTASGVVEAAAGVTLSQIHEAVRGSGWRFPLDLGSRDVATVGGMVATNAGGHLAVRFGTMRRLLSGLEWVGADGGIHSRMTAPAKDNSGYDLMGLLAGSEGTLGVVTAARLVLVPDPAQRLVARIECATTRELIDTTARLLQAPALEAVEFMCAECLGLGAAPVTVLAEFASDGEVLAAAAPWLDDGVAVAIDPVARRRAWAERDAIPQRIRAEGVALKCDVGLPLEGLADFLDVIGERCRAVAPQAVVWRFGHAGDGNVHLNVTGVPVELHEAIETAVFAEVLERGGTIAAEHGVGVAKAPWVERIHAPADLAVMRAVKAALDPAGILNPGVILPTAPATRAPPGAPRPDPS